MEFIREMSIRLLLSVLIYCVLTLPHLTLVIFGYGIKYNTVGIYTAAFITILSVPIIRHNQKYNN